jgi:hypothetical protein
MVFGSLEEMVAYIKRCNAVAANEMGQRATTKATNIINSQLKGYSARPSPYNFPYQGTTGQTANTPTVVSASSSGMVAELAEKGNWYSVITGEYFFALRGLESGSTWGNQTHIMDSWNSWCASNLDRIYLAKMQALGVPIG